MDGNLIAYCISIRLNFCETENLEDDVELEKFD